ncbi:MAG: uroporphyrinogen decarboxylase/cobalamine-independent methonine synthase family protein [Chloroflexota bacterium]
MGLTFEPRLLATTLGSLPHVDVAGATNLLLRYTPDIPTWVQFPKLGESMMRQFNDGLPGLSEAGGLQYVDVAGAGFDDSLTDFYTYYLAVTEELEGSALDTFAIPWEHARGLPELLRQVDALEEPPLAIKGQVTGPFTLGTNLVDQDFRAVYYDERLRDVIVKLIGLKARWQVRQLRQVCPRVMIFLDEPALLGYGSATFISISREDVIRDLNEVAAAIHEEGALAGVHCEENTDFSLLMDSRLDFIDFDAWAHTQAIALYPESLTGYLERGGSLGWGLVPTLDPEAAGTVTVPELVEYFDRGLERLARKGFPCDLLVRRALLTPSCGAGTLTEALAERVLSLLHDTSLELRERYGLA